MITWNEVEKNWPNFKTKIHTKWNKLTDNDLEKIHGNRNQLVTTLETRYHVSEMEAKKEIDTFLQKANPIK
jgi:uncharacterized protein YjbJ (UPF0337 family)